MFFTPCREVSGDEGSRHTSRTRGRTMSSSSYLFTFLNALPIIMVATKKTSKPWEPSPYYSSRFTSEALIDDIPGGLRKFCRHAQILGTRPEHAKGLAIEGAATEEAEEAEGGEGRGLVHDARRRLPGEAGRL